MKTFDYLDASRLEAVWTGKPGAGTVLKAGGIDLMDRMKERLESPDTVLNISRIDALRFIREDGDGLQIGALTTLADLARHDRIREAYPVLHQAVSDAATPQVRERATVGGNLCQRPRCWYYRSADFRCLKKGGPICYAVEEENQYHAILGGGPCHIVHPSNCAPPLLALDAEATVASASSTRTVTLRDLFVLPSQDLDRETVLEPGEIITAIRIPAAPEQSATIELREKQSFDWPVALASVARVRGAWSVCLGAVAPVPWLSEAAGSVLGSRDLTPELAGEAARAAVRDAVPMSGNRYKVQLARVAVERALLKATGREVPE